MTPNEKRKRLARLIELYIYCGYSIENFVGKPLSYFNFESVVNRIETLKIEKEKIDGEKLESEQY